MAVDFPAWMQEVLDDIESGEDPSPVMEFESHAEAAGARLRFYKFLTAKVAEGNGTARKVSLKWESNDGTRVKRFLRFVAESETGGPKRVSGSARTELDERTEVEKALADMRKKFGGQ